MGALARPLQEMRWYVAAVLVAVMLAACGGGSAAPTGTGATGSAASTTGGSGVGNQVALSLDAGPTVGGKSLGVVNIPYITVTVCPPGGSGSQCTTIDHVEVDTGSVGLRLLSEASSSLAALPAAKLGGTTPLAECVQFADGYSWGAVRQADVYIGGEVALGQSVHIIGDAAFPSVPSGCSNGLSAENTVATFGAKGILGIGSFLNDCGTFCTNQAIPGTYYTCATGNCTATAVPVNTQVGNTVAAFAVDNNGTVISLPAVPTAGQASATGTLTFGIETQSNNRLGTAQTLGLNSVGELTTVYRGTSLTNSFFDSGSTLIYFSDNAIAACSSDASLYCPSSPLTLSATNMGTNGASSTVSFGIGNFQNLVNANPTFAAIPNLGGKISGLSGLSGAFDWGIPFFFGRSVFTALEQHTVGGNAGPFVAY